MRKMWGVIVLLALAGGCCPPGFETSISSDPVYFPDADACDQATRQERDGLIELATDGCKDSCDQCEGTIQDPGGEPNFSVACEEVDDLPDGPENPWRGVGTYSYGCDCN